MQDFMDTLYISWLTGVFERTPLILELLSHNRETAPTRESKNAPTLIAVRLHRIGRYIKTIENTWWDWGRYESRSLEKDEEKMKPKLRKYPFKTLYISTALCIWYEFHSRSLIRSKCFCCFFNYSYRFQRIWSLIWFHLKW